MNARAVGAVARGAARTAPALGLFALLALLLASCAHPAGGETEGAFAPERAERVFSAGFEGVRRYHIDPPDLPALALAGLNGLAAIDPALRVERADGRIAVFRRGEPVARLAAPRGEMSARWGRLAAEAVEAARRASPPLAAAGPERIYEAVFDAAFATLDRFTRYLSAEEARSSRAGRRGYSGIGASIDGRDGAFFLREVFEDGPARDAGLQPGDRIRAVDGAPVADWTLARVAGALRGPAGSGVEVVLSRGGETLRRRLVRRRVIRQTVYAEVADGVAVLRVTGFNRRTPARLEARLAEALRETGPALRGAVIDLRGNRGGMLDEAVAAADIFIAGGTILSTAGRHADAARRFEASAGDRGENLALAVLIDKDTASAAEALAAALRDGGRALVVGARSRGKGTVQRVRKLPNGGETNITWARMRAPSGRPLSRDGVAPAVRAADLRETALDFALRLLREPERFRRVLDDPSLAAGRRPPG